MDDVRSLEFVVFEFVAGCDLKLRSYVFHDVVEHQIISPLPAQMPEFVIAPMGDDRDINDIYQCLKDLKLRLRLECTFRILIIALYYQPSSWQLH